MRTCPKCKGELVTDVPSVEDGDADYYCATCEELFDESDLVVEFVDRRER